MRGLDEHNGQAGYCTVQLKRFKVLLKGRLAGAKVLIHSFEPAASSSVTTLRKCWLRWALDRASVALIDEDAPGLCLTVRCMSARAARSQVSRAAALRKWCLALPDCRVATTGRVVGEDEDVFCVSTCGPIVVGLLGRLASPTVLCACPSRGLLADT